MAAILCRSQPCDNNILLLTSLGVGRKSLITVCITRHWKSILCTAAPDSLEIVSHKLLKFLYKFCKLLCFLIISNTEIISPPNFAHGPTAVLSGHVQNSVVVRFTIFKSCNIQEWSLYVEKKMFCETSLRLTFLVQMGHTLVVWEFNVKMSLKYK